MLSKVIFPILMIATNVLAGGGGGGDVINQIGNALNPDTNGVSNAFNNAGQTLGTALNPDTNRVSNAFNNAGQTLGNALNPDTNGVGNAFNNAGQTLGNALDPTKNGFLDANVWDNAFDPSKNGFDSAFQQFGNELDPTKNGFLDANVWSNAFTPVGNALDPTKNGFLDANVWLNAFDPSRNGFLDDLKKIPQAIFGGGGGRNNQAPSPPPPLHSLTGNIVSSSSLAQPLCIELNAGAMAPMLTVDFVDVANCTGSTSQMFSFALTPIALVPGLFSMGLIQLANVRNNLCLDATVNGGGSGTNVVQGACLSNQTKEGYNQQWLYHVETSTIRPYYNISLCLDAPSSSNGRLVVDDCGSFSQLWVFPGTISSSGVGAVSIPSPPPPPPPPPLHSLTSNIISATSGTQPLCIDQTGSGTIDVTTCNSATAGAALNQMFKFAFTPIASVPGLYNMGAIQLANGGSSNSNLCLDATANGGGSGTSVIQGACQSIQTQAGYNQQWFYHVRTSTIRPFYSASLCLDVNGSSSGGKTLVVTNCVGSFSQIWSFLSTSTPTPPPPPPVQSPTVVHNNNNIAKVDAVRIVTVALQPDTKPSTTVTTTTAIQKPTTTTIVPVSIATVTTCAADCHNHPIKNRCARGKQCKLVAKASLANHHCPVYKCL